MSVDAGPRPGKLEVATEALWASPLLPAPPARSNGVKLIQSLDPGRRETNR